MELKKADRYMAETYCAEDFAPRRVGAPSDWEILEGFVDVSMATYTKEALDVIYFGIEPRVAAILMGAVLIIENS